MRSGNPALNDKVFTTGFAPAAERMTLQGTVVKALLLLLLVMLSAAWIWGRFYSGVSGAIEPSQLERNLADIYPWMIGGMIGGMIAALVTIFKKSWAGITAPLYALF